MKQNNPIIIVKVALAICLLLHSACSDFVDIDPPKDEITSETVFKGEQTATSALYGIYSQMNGTSLFLSSGGTTVFAGLSSDELFNTNTAVANQNQFFQNSILPTNTDNTNLWTRGYSHIYQANNVIEGLSSAAGATMPNRDQLLGEAKFIRAFFHFYLTNFFGDVPLLTTTDYRANGVAARKPVAEVYAQVIQDLREAKEHMNSAYPTAGRIRPNKWAAAALLARVYLYTKDWANAELIASEVINSGMYVLEPNLNNAFLATSREAIWQLVPVVAGFNTTEARNFVPSATGTARPNFALTNNAYNAYESGDSRRASWVGTKVVSGTPVYYPNKYKVMALNQPVTEYYIVLRFAEQFLIRAEARIQLNKLTGMTGGVSDLNVIRTRAGLGTTTAASQTALLNAVEHERRIELMAEWGHRWFDLKRTGRADAVLAPVKPGWKPTAALFPLPTSQLNLNPALNQNPGY